MIDNENAHLSGEYAIELNGQPVALKRSLGALKAFNNAPGGLESRTNPAASTVVTRLLARDMATICMVIRAGLGVGPSALPKLDEWVFEAGVDEIVPELANYIFLVRTKPGTPLPGSKAEEEAEEERKRLAEGGESTENPSDSN